MVLSKPSDVFDRDTEWADLAEFVSSDAPGLRIAIVYGRRRQGKSYLLRRLAEANQGIYHLATEQTEAVSVRRFSDSLAAFFGVPPETLAVSGWEAALRSAVRLMSQRADTSASPPPLLVLDEFPYLTHETPGLPSILQTLYDEFGPGSLSNRAPLRLILCGSAISVMSELLSGTKALRGRGALELRIKPFGYRDARTYWGIHSVETAFVHNALIGGTPGYRDLTLDAAVPEDPNQIGDWMAQKVLRPVAPLFSEANRIIYEDPRIRDTASYSSLMAAIAAGESSPAKIGGLMGRPASSLTYQLGMLESAGFIDRRADVLIRRRPAITVADPIMRLHLLIMEPYLADLEAGRAQQIWQEVAHTVDSKIFGPHFEALVTEWVTRYANDEAGLAVGVTGQATISCREHKASHEIDVLSLARGIRAHTPGAKIAFFAEAKSRDRKPGLAELRRLAHIKDILIANGYDAGAAKMGLFSTAGFTDELIAEAKGNHQILLTGLASLYGEG